MMDARTQQVVVRSRIQHIAFEQEEIQRSWLRDGQCVTQLPRSIECGLRGVRFRAPATERHDAAVLADLHARVKERQPIAEPRSPYCQRIVGIERKEPQAGYTVAMHVGAHVDLIRVAQSWNRRQQGRAHARNGESDQAYPCRSFEQVKVKRCRHEGPNHVRRKTPMQKHQPAPSLVQDRPTRRPTARRNAVDHA